MSTTGEISQSGGGSGNSFINHVFNFDHETKNSLMNLSQYILLAIIPLNIANHFIDNIVPNADDSKGNIEIFAEVSGQVIFTFLLIFLIHRLITFIPTYSGRAYDSLNLINLVLAFLVICYDCGKVGKKVKILLERVQELWEGKAKEQPKQKQQPNGRVVITQPISGLQQPQPTHQASRADYVQANQAMQPSQAAPAPPPQQEAMAGGLQNSQIFEPMAANGALGGSFGSAF
tara:strand:- start:917 stop:1612 length:696 start_codon:yes stop_codon:yes gene_type:complete